VPEKTLFPIEEAVQRGTIIQYLVSDAAQMILWPKVKANLKKAMRCISRMVFHRLQRPNRRYSSDYVDVILVAPKGSGASVRTNYLAGAGINSSFAGASGLPRGAMERTLAIGLAIGSGYLFPTTFQNEVFPI